MPKVAVTVKKDGSTNIDFIGYTGPSCLAVDEKLRACLSALGVQVEETSFVGKPELNFNEEEQFHSQHQRGEA